jgi:nucleolar MIF4G domain-containing protein 1
MKLRGDDPGAMKDFILSIQNSVNQLKLHSAVREDGKADIHSKRVSCLVQYTHRKHYLAAMFYYSLTGFNL